MKTIYLIRHGESEHNAKGLMAGWTDGALTEKGHQQARETAEKLVAYPIERIYASDLRRAQETAAPLAEKLGLEVKRCPELREIHMGDWEGYAFGDLNAHVSAFQAWQDDPVAFCYPGGESGKAVLERVRPWLEKVLAEAPDHFAIYSHGLTLGLLIAAWVFGDGAFSQRFQLRHGGITIIQQGEDYTLLKQLNG